MKNIEAVIFDMDGVLIDAKEWHYHALNRALELFGYSISRIDHLTTFDGLPTRKKLELISMERGLPRALHEFLNQLKQLYTTEQIHVNCRPVFAHEYAISRLKAEGYKLGLASNSVRSSVKLMMERSSLLVYFDVMLSNEDVSKAKPDPEMYLTAASRLGVTPGSCLVVEDNHNGIRSAEAAGCNVLVVHDVDDVTYGKVRSAIDRFEGVDK